MQPLDVLKEAFSDKARTRALEAVAEIEKVVSESAHLEQLVRDTVAAISAYDTSLTDISLPEGIRRLRVRIDEQAKETSLLRELNQRSDEVITACKVALVDTVTADHRWHTSEENCPHARCIALNKIEALRG